MPDQQPVTPVRQQAAPSPQLDQTPAYTQPRGNAAAIEALPPPSGRRSDDEIVADIIGSGEQGVPGILGVGDGAILSATRFMFIYSAGPLAKWGLEFVAQMRQNHPDAAAAPFVRAIEALSLGQGGVMKTIRAEALDKDDRYLAGAQIARQRVLLCQTAGVADMRALQAVFTEAASYEEFDSAAFAVAKGRYMPLSGVSKAEELGFDTVVGKAMSSHAMNGGPAHCAKMLAAGISGLKQRLQGIETAEAARAEVHAVLTAMKAAFPTSLVGDHLPTDVPWVLGITDAWLDGTAHNRTKRSLLDALVAAKGEAKARLAEQITTGTWASCQWGFPYCWNNPGQPFVMHSEWKAYLTLASSDPDLREQGDVVSFLGKKVAVTEAGKAQLEGRPARPDKPKVLPPPGASKPAPSAAKETSWWEDMLALTGSDDTAPATHGASGSWGSWTDDLFGAFDEYVAMGQQLNQRAKPEAAPRIRGNPVLRPGARGDDVRALQTALVQVYDASIPVTGVFDAATSAAVVAAQLAAGVHADGLVGEQTAAAFNSRRKKPIPVGQGQAAGWRSKGAATDGPKKDDVQLDVPFMNQHTSYAPDGSAWTGGEKAFAPGNTSCVDAAQAMALITGAVSADTIKAQQDVILLFSAVDEVASGGTMWGEQAAQLDRTDDARLAEVRARTLDGIAYIDAELEAGRAVVVGVSFSTANRNKFIPDATSDDYERARGGSGTLDHGVVITGRKGGRYVFNDPGRSQEAYGKGRLFVRDSDGILKSDPADHAVYGGPYYEVCSVIKNNG